ncbi:MAG: DUF4258 domain-containing protein [Deltaproteobacteria bacterium]|nr:DUF4258 domain-containing protein [Deltaproteobacteria bacterium]
MTDNIKKKILESASQRILFLPHAINQINRVDRMISPNEVRHVILNGEIIEDYCDDPRGHSCLMFDFVTNRPIHIVCAPKEGYLAIITAYIPEASKWTPDFKRRLKP